MKKNILFLFVLLILFACGNNSTSADEENSVSYNYKPLSESGEAEKAIIETLCTSMLEAGVNDYDKEYISLISPEYIEKNNINLEDYYTINYYSPESFTIESYDKKTGIIKVILYYGESSVKTFLEFKIVNIDDKLYLVPEEHDTEKGIIDPWFRSS